ncbi:MAG: CCA tRNA nucleotidyltransferase [Chloroflexi bacterium]|nr:CCA tRNA nucleotidyltransferase [Chloroflexota bacterium]
MTDGRAVSGLVAALLPRGTQRVLALAEQCARATDAHPYLVGGTVRDLLLGQPGPDLDLVVEGDAGALATALGAALGAAVTPHPDFSTASLALPWPTWDDVGDPAARLPPGQDGLHLDLAATRREMYPRHGALPLVTTGVDLAADLLRRDFTVNAMALPAAGDPLIDPYGGADDLAAGRLQTLHPASFDDDPTRLVRGARLAGRLSGRFAAETEAQVRAAVEHGRLGLVSGERRRHELELLLAEPRPGPALAHARAHGILEQIHPALRWDAWLAARLNRTVPWAADLPRWLPRLLLCAYRWPIDTIEGFVGLTRPEGALTTALEALPRWHARRPALARAGGGAAVAAALDGLPTATLTAARLAEDEPAIVAALDWYVTDLRQRRPRLSGTALRQLGLPPGPAYRPLLAALRRAVLDGELPDEATEWIFLTRLVAGQPPAPRPE